MSIPSLLQSTDLDTSIRGRPSQRLTSCVSFERVEFLVKSRHKLDHNELHLRMDLGVRRVVIVIAD